MHSQLQLTPQHELLPIEKTTSCPQLCSTKTTYFETNALLYNLDYIDCLIQSIGTEVETFHLFCTLGLKMELSFLMNIENQELVKSGNYVLMSFGVKNELAQNSEHLNVLQGRLWAGCLEMKALQDQPPCTDSGTWWIRMPAQRCFLHHGQQTTSVKSQRVNILDFATTWFLLQLFLFLNI